MLEKDFQNEVIKFLKDHNFYYVKVWGGGFQRAGIPDLLICKKGKFLAVELKTEIGKPTALQTHNINLIKASGGQAYVLRPSGFEKFKEEMLNV